MNKLPYLFIHETFLLNSISSVLYPNRNAKKLWEMTLQKGRIETLWQEREVVSPMAEEDAEDILLEQ